MDYSNNGTSDDGLNANQEYGQHQDIDRIQDGEGSTSIENRIIMEALPDSSILSANTTTNATNATTTTNAMSNGDYRIDYATSNSDSRIGSTYTSSIIRVNGLSSANDAIINAENNHNNNSIFTSESNDENREKNAAAKRKAIQSILKNNEWTELEKRLKIQALMDGRVTNLPGVSSSLSSICRKVPFTTSSTSSLSSLINGGINLKTGSSDTVAVNNCAHYERNCNIISPCCSKIFGCRICHDEAMQDHHGPMDRFATTHVVCKVCHTKQEKSNKCIKCEITFAEYYCDICNIWMSLSKEPFHCHKCGFCRVGGRENFEHCDECCMCISIKISKSEHNCLKDKYKNNCPVCREDMFSSRQSPQDLPCGHAIHAHCFRRLAMYDFRCPICKKNVMSKESMEAAWAARARDIALQPMPPDLVKIVSIVCFDCYEKSSNLNWHLLGVQCPKCQSFNTDIDQNASNSTENDDNNHENNEEDTFDDNAESNESDN